jgi:hypothetical protein
MSITIRDLLTSSLRLISVVSEGNTPTAQQLNDALFTLNELMDSWNVDGTMIYTMGINTFPINNSKQVWTIGPTGDFNVAARPVYIEFAALQTTNTTPFTDIPMTILNADEWASIRNKTISSTIPRWIYMDEAYPLANIYLWPAPSASANLVLTYWQALNSALTLDTTLQMPPGYQRLMRYGTAINIAPEYGRQVQPEIGMAYNNLLSEVSVANLRPGRINYDTIVMVGGTYNVLDDQIY